MLSKVGAIIILLVAAITVFPQAESSRSFDVQKVADGIYAVIRREPASFWFNAIEAARNRGWGYKRYADAESVEQVIDNLSLTGTAHFMNSHRVAPDAIKFVAFSDNIIEKRNQGYEK
jgi:hypothetical protein